MEREPDDEDDERGPCETHAHVEATSVIQRLSTRTGTGNSSRRSPGPRRWFSFAHGIRARSYTRPATGSGSQWTSGSRVCTSIGNQRFGCREEHATPDPQRFADECLLPVPPADVLDHGVRVDDVEGVVGERQGARVALDVRDTRVPLPEARAVVETERREPRRPRICLLEDVVGRAAALAAGLTERDLVDPDVEHRRLGSRPHELPEQGELAPSRAE